MEFEGLRLGFPEIRYWGEFSTVVDPGIAPLFAGFAVGIIGLAMRLGRGRAELSWEESRTGAGGVLSGWGAAQRDEFERRLESPSAAEQGGVE